MASRANHYKSDLAVTRRLARILEDCSARPARRPGRIGCRYHLRARGSEDARALFEAVDLQSAQGACPATRSVRNAEFLETLRELAAMDGAFVVDRRGVVVSAGTYPHASIAPNSRLRPGLGARHAATLASRRSRMRPQWWFRNLREPYRSTTARPFSNWSEVFDHGTLLWRIGVMLAARTREPPRLAGRGVFFLSPLSWISIPGPRYLIGREVKIRCREQPSHNAVMPGRCSAQSV